MNTKPLTKDLIGKRILVKEYNSSYWTNPVEAGVFEVSPSGEYCKIQIRRQDDTTYTKWCNVTDYILVEELPSVMDKIADEWKKWEDKTTQKYTPPPYKTGDFFDHLPTSICSSDYADAPDWHATNYSSEVKKQKWVHGICNPPADDAKEYVKNCKSTGKRYNSVDQMLKSMMKEAKKNK